MPVQEQISYIDYSDSLGCVSIKNFAEGVKCSFEQLNSTHDKLIIKDGIAIDQTMDTTNDGTYKLVLEIDSIRNPWTMAEQSFTV
jgi:hypothetical protein